MSYNKLEQYRIVADQGDADAQFFLGIMYYLGNSALSVAQDYAQAEIWFRRAADQGFRAAQDYLNRIQTNQVP
jgi:TPR repeat protein